MFYPLCYKGKRLQLEVSFLSPLCTIQTQKTHPSSAEIINSIEQVGKNKRRERKYCYSSFVDGNYHEMKYIRSLMIKSWWGQACSQLELKKTKEETHLSQKYEVPENCPIWSVLSDLYSKRTQPEEAQPWKTPTTVRKEPETRSEQRLVMSSPVLPGQWAFCWRSYKLQIK